MKITMRDEWEMNGHPNHQNNAPSLTQVTNIVKKLLILTLKGWNQ